MIDAKKLVRDFIRAQQAEGDWIDPVKVAEDDMQAFDERFQAVLRGENGASEGQAIREFVERGGDTALNELRAAWAEFCDACVSEARELEQIEAAVAELAKAIRDLDAEDEEDLVDSVGDGFPISFDVEFDDENNAVDSIDVAVGHAERFEWHGTGKTLEDLRRMSSEALSEFLEDHVRVAIENHREYQCA